MPNWINNTLKTDKKFKDVCLFLKSEKSLVDFNKIVEMPENLNITSSTNGEVGLKYLIENAESRIFKKELIKPSDECIELGKKYLHNIADYGFKTWYDWSCANWGTKWNACEVNVSSRMIKFDTAWSGVIDLIKKLSLNFSDVEFYYSVMQEYEKETKQSFTIKNGEVNK